MSNGFIIWGRECNFDGTDCIDSINSRGCGRTGPRCETYDQGDLGGGDSVLVDGQPSDNASILGGFRVPIVRARGEFAKRGIRDGAEIVAVGFNGGRPRSLKTRDELTGIFTASQITIVVEQDGQEITISYKNGE